MIKEIELRLLQPNDGQIEGLPSNPRTIDKDKFEKLKKSLTEDPEMLQLRELLVYEHDGKYVIIGGNMRYHAAKELKFKTLPCKIIPKETSIEKLKAITIKDNSSFGSYDWDMLANSWDADLLTDWGLDLPTDWDTTEEETREAIEDDFTEEDAANAETRVKAGEIWQLGEHRLMCGDSTKKEDVERLMNGEKADMNFMSPPYNIGKNAQLNDRDKDNKYLSYDDENDNYKDLLYKSTENSINNSKYSFINIQMLSGNKEVFCEYINEFKKKLCDISIWYKDNVAPAMARRVMNSAFEFILIFSSQNVNRAIGTRDFRGDVCNVYQSHIQCNNEYSKIHSATFPVDFVSNYIRIFTNENEIVSDLFGGTGTTLIACEQLNRKARLMELDPRYCDVIIARWGKLTGKEAVKIYG